MKALSIRQPWPWCIINLDKRLENRDWQDRNPGLKFRGHFLIHASAGMTRAEYEETRDFLGTIFPAWLRRLPPMADLQRGGIVGAARITGIVRESESPWFFGPLALQLEDVRAAPVFIPWKGALGFFDVPEAIAIESGLFHAGGRAA